MSPLMTNLVVFMIVVFTIVGVDLLFGASLIKGISQLFNRKVDVDNVVIKRLSSIRLQGEREVVRIDEKTLQGRLRIFLAALLLLPAAMLFFVVFIRK